MDTLPKEIIGEIIDKCEDIDILKLYRTSKLFYIYPLSEYNDKYRTCFGKYIEDHSELVMPRVNVVHEYHLGTHIISMKKLKRKKLFYSITGKGLLSSYEKGLVLGLDYSSYLSEKTRDEELKPNIFDKWVIKHNLNIDQYNWINHYLSENIKRKLLKKYNVDRFKLILLHKKLRNLDSDLLTLHFGGYTEINDKRFKIMIVDIKPMILLKFLFSNYIDKC